MEKNNTEIFIDTPSPEMIGQRLDKALSLVAEVGTRSRAEYLIDKGLVLVNQIAAKASYKIKPSDAITISLPEQESETLIPLDLNLDILFEDKDIIVINKPAGLVVHPAAGHQQDTLVNALIHHTNDLSMKFGEARPGIVHRLDKDTSGILVIAKNDFSHESLALQFRDRSIHRIYFAITVGFLPKRQGSIQSFLARHPMDRKRYASVRDSTNKVITDRSNPPSHGKWAMTHFQVLKSLPSGINLVQLKLETGRTHQIRVHLSEAGSPIAGDTLYGAQKKIPQIKSSDHRHLIKSIPRFALHAAELAFEHPTSKKPLSFKVDWPEDIKPLLAALGFRDGP